MAKISEEYLRQARVKFREIMQEEATKTVVEMSRFKKAKDMIGNCNRMLETYQKDNPKETK